MACYNTGGNVFNKNKANCWRKRVVSTFMPLSEIKQWLNGEKYNPASSDRWHLVAQMIFFGCVAVCHLKTTPGVEMGHFVVKWFLWLIYDLNRWCHFLISVQRNPQRTDLMESSMTCLAPEKCYNRVIVFLFFFFLLTNLKLNVIHFDL